MLYREIIAVCSKIHTKHINTLCVQNVELLNVKLAVHIVTALLYNERLLADYLTAPYSTVQSVAPPSSHTTLTGVKTTKHHYTVHGAS